MIRRFDSSASVHLISESSYDSRSAETAVKATSTTNIFDEVLVPLIAESNRSTKSKGIIFTISIIVVVIQIILGSFFCIINNKQIPKWLQKVGEVFFLGYSNESFQTNQRFIMLVFLLFSFVALIIIIINFKYITHEFSKFTLGFVRLWFGDLFSIFIIPTFVSTVGSFIYYGTHPEIQNAFFAFVHTLLLFLCFFISRYLTENLERNIYISSSPIFFWKTIPFYNSINLYGIAFATCPFDVIFTNWKENIPQVLLIIISPLVSLCLLEKCFQKPAFNAIAISLPVFSFLGGLMSLINNIFDDFPQVVYFVIPVAGFVISHIIYTLFIIYYKDKKIKELLSKNIELTDEEKLQLFESAKIRKKDKCYFCLVGLVNKCPLFLNWSLSHYLIDRDPEDMDFLTFTTWLVSFFPSETRIMNSYLGLISKYPYLTFSERCSFFQLHRIYVLRESSSSTSLEAAADFRPVHEQSEKVIAYISNFWRFAASDPEEIQDSIFHLISKERKQAETMWTDLLEKYPNNAQMMHDYARFLANGESKFQKAIQNHQKATQMESGTVAKNDKAFKCFLLRFPEYLKRGYVDNKGRLVMSKVMMKDESNESTDNNKGTKLNDISYISMNSSESNYATSSSVSANFDSSTNSQEFDMFGEKQIDMEEAKSFIKMTELRVAMEKSLEQYRSSVSAKIWVASILRLILSIALCFVIFFIVYFQYPEKEVLFSHLTKFNRAFHLFELVNNLYPWSFMAVRKDYPDNEFFFMGNIRFHQCYVNTSSEIITLQIANLSKKILDYVDQFSYDLYSADTRDSSTDFVIYYSQEMLNNRVCIEIEDDLGKRVEIQEEKESTTMDSLFKTVITVFLKLSSYDSEKKRDWYKKDNYCDMFIQSLLLRDYAKDLISTISPSIEDAFSGFTIDDDDIDDDIGGGDDGGIDIPGVDIPVGGDDDWVGGGGDIPVGGDDGWVGGGGDIPIGGGNGDGNPDDSFGGSGDGGFGVASILSQKNNKRKKVRSNIKNISYNIQKDAHKRRLQNRKKNRVNKKFVDNGDSETEITKNEILDNNTSNEISQRKTITRHRRTKISTRIKSFLSNLFSSVKNLIVSPFSKSSEDSQKVSSKKSRRRKTRKNLGVKSKRAHTKEDPPGDGGVDGDFGGVDTGDGGADGDFGGVDGDFGGVDGYFGGVDGDNGGVDGDNGGVDGDNGGVDGDNGGVDGGPPDDDLTDDNENMTIDDFLDIDKDNDSEGFSILDFFMGFIPFFVTLFSFPSLIFLSSSLNKEKEDLVNLLIGTSEEEATAASHVVTGKASSSTIQMSSASNKSYAWLWSGLSLIIVIACLMIIIGIAQIKESKQETYIQHLSFMILERNFVFDIGRDLFYYLIYNYEAMSDFDLLETIFLDRHSSIKNLKTDFEYYDKIATIIRDGTEHVTQVNGFDSSIDDLRYGEKCHIENYFDPEDYYYQDCISLDRLVTFFVGQSKMIMQSPFSITDNEFIYLNSLILTRFAHDFEEIANKYEDRFNKKSNLYDILCIVLFILAILCTIGAFLIELFLLIRFHNEIAIFRTLVLRLNPLYFVSNPDLLSTVYKSGKNDKAVTSSSHAMFQTAHDALFILKEDLIIESVNPAATNIFGFTPEQMLGQSIKFILPNDLNSSTYYVVDLMMSGATSLNYESDATGTKDDGSDVPLRLSVIGLTQDKNNSEYDREQLSQSDITNQSNIQENKNENQDINNETKNENNEPGNNNEKESNDKDENKENGNNGDSDGKENSNQNESTNKDTRSITGGKKATAFAFIMKDMTEEQRQKQAVEEAKKQAEVILLQILPKDIIMRLNRGDKDITFTVDSSTIVFCDIEKFSQYSATLSAKDIMLNLSRIFTAFDKICSTFNLITKIKMIGDDYMAAAGLFTPDINPQEHATQVVQFAMQCHEALEEQNVLLNASLQCRIGINTDGPIIAGVLGTEKPLFDIIGDPINVASRLQSTCIPGLIQISEGTYKLVANMDYKIEERGEIMLKGKGKRKTFLIYPETHEQTKAFTEQDSSISSSILHQIVNNADSNSITLSKNKNQKKNPK